MKKNILFLLAFTSLLICHAQTPQWIVYNTSNCDLTSNFVSAIAIENNNKWIGTGHGFGSGALWGGGLTKFDNCSWTVYQNPDAELQNKEFTIWSIAIDEDNIKWFGTNEFSPDAECLVSFDNENWTNYDTLNSEIPDYIVTEIKIDQSNNKWIGTYWGGLAKFDGTNWTVYNTENSELPSNHITSIVIEPNSNLWVGTANGLAHFDGTNWITFNTSNSGLPSNSILSLARDPLGMIWIGTNVHGLVMYNGTDWTIYNIDNSELPDNHIRTIAIESSDVKWLGTRNGLVRLTSSSTTVYNYGNSDLPAEVINTIKIDEYGNKWIGTENGLAVFNSQGVVIPCNPLNLSNNSLDETISVYPNPTINTVRIKGVNSGQVELLNLQGQVVKTIILSNENSILDLSELSNGIYILKIQSKKGQVMKKILKQ